MDNQITAIKERLNKVELKERKVLNTAQVTYVTKRAQKVWVF